MNRTFELFKLLCPSGRILNPAPPDWLGPRAVWQGPSCQQPAIPKLRNRNASILSLLSIRL